ncbi:MAG: hypothetical protein EBU01_13025 [Crocinitomicaceae bacterium]|nr:hypothetical protein [Crocinitomicaceae bacterium]
MDDVLVHVFTDGRDTDPKSGIGFIKEKTKIGHIVTALSK